MVIWISKKDDVFKGPVVTAVKISAIIWWQFSIIIGALIGIPAMIFLWASFDRSLGYGGLPALAAYLTFGGLSMLVVGIVAFHTVLEFYKRKAIFKSDGVITKAEKRQMVTHRANISIILISLVIGCNAGCWAYLRYIIYEQSIGWLILSYDIGTNSILMIISIGLAWYDARKVNIFIKADPTMTYSPKGPATVSQGRGTFSLVGSIKAMRGALRTKMQNFLNRYPRNGTQSLKK